MTVLPGGLATGGAEPDPVTTTTAPTETSTANRVVGTLTLSPDQGTPASAATATARGLPACRVPALLWDTGRLDNVRLDNAEFTGDDPASGTVTFDFTVPDTAEPGPHTVTAACATRSESSIVLSTTAPATFTVQTTVVPTLTLNPGDGSHGSEVMVSGSGFSCGAVDAMLLWDNEYTLGERLPAEFTQRFTVPSGADLGTHYVVAWCRDRPETMVRQPFTVSAAGPVPSVETAPVTNSAPIPATTSSPIPVTTTRVASNRVDPPPEPGFRWWLVALITAAVVVLLGSAYVRSRGRKPSTQPAPDVEARLRPSAGPNFAVRETPGQRETALTVRLEPHPDPGTRTLREV